MKTYYYLMLNEHFAVELEDETITGICGPIDGRRQPVPGEALDLRSWDYDTPDGDTSLHPYEGNAAILAVQEDLASVADWYVEAK